MKNKLQMAKSRAMFLMILFALFITLLVFVLSSKVIYDFQRRVTVQSVAFNLRLVASLIGQDMRDLESLVRWCGTNETIASSLFKITPPPPQWRDGIDGWRRLSEEFYNNRASHFINRLLIFNYESKRLLQIGNQINASLTVSEWNVDLVYSRGISSDPGWQGISPDPFYLTRDVPVIPLVYPLYHPNRGTPAGSVALAASTAIITERFTGYNAPSGTELYFAIHGKYYGIDGTNLIPAYPVWTQLSRTIKDTIHLETEVLTIRDGEGRLRTMVRSRILDGIFLVQVLPRLGIFPMAGEWSILTAGLIILLLLLALLWLGINRQTGELVRLMEERIADEKNARDLEYRMLLSQINPHFLYNTLNSIKWMATIQKSSGIAEMITALSRLLRSVTKDVRRSASLREEIALLEDYLVIQKYRYGNSVSFKKIIDDEDLLDTAIPRFVLQPLVENAIFHGLEPKGGGTITLRVQEDHNVCSRVLVSIEDDGIGMSEETIVAIRVTGCEKGGVFQEVGIHNVEERLRYAGAEGISIKSEEGKWTVMTIALKRESAYD
ncbi:MAG: sensor histidine kinase [Treponema sp.]|jgi:two-component system sensor histidine kinase YesM|nr:sensor histidine kinase [Treponema sp.]